MDLDQEGFFELPHATAPSAVYLLLWKGQVVYVGQSVAVYSRIADHRSAMNRALRRKRQSINNGSIRLVLFDKVLVRFCSQADLDRLEFEYIQRYDPPGNVQLKREEIYDTNIDLAALGIKWTSKKSSTDSSPMRRI